MTGKGQTSLPFAAIYATVAMLLVIGIAYGSQVYTADFMKKEMVDLQADRVSKAALALNSMPSGYIELSLTGYEFQWDESENKVNIYYKESVGSKKIKSSYFADVSGPSDAKKVEDKICLEKNDDDELSFSVGGC